MGYVAKCRTASEKREMREIVEDDISKEDLKSMSIAELHRKYAEFYSYSTFRAYLKTFRRR